MKHAAGIVAFIARFVVLGLALAFVISLVWPGVGDRLRTRFGFEQAPAAVASIVAPPVSANVTAPASYADAVTEAAPSVITIGDVEIDLVGQLVRLAGEEVHLTPTEFALLRELALNRGKLLSRAYLLRRVWGDRKSVV